MSDMQFANMAKASLAAYQGRDPSFAPRLQFWIDQLGETPVRSITTEQIEDAVDVLLARKAQRVVAIRENGKIVGTVMRETDEKLSPSTVKRYIAALGSCYRIAREERIVRGLQSPIRGLTKLPGGECRTVNVTVADVRRLVDACRVSRNRKLAALVAMACTTGWRRGTLQALRWRDIDLTTGHADAGRTKNGTPHRAVLLPWVVTELRRMRPGQAAADDLVFGTTDCTKAWRAALRLARLPEEWTLHHCRHIAASVLAQSGASVPVIMACLNHKTPSMALRYSHLNTDALRENLSRAWG